MRGLVFRGRPPIAFAGSVKDVVRFDNPYAKAIMDRSTPIDEDFINAIIGQSVLSWEGRNPRPALDVDGNFQGTDLDLLSFLAPLAERKAVIEFSKYLNLRASEKRSNERRVGTPSRFGPILAMTSNQKFFNFSVRILDSTVIVTDPVTGLETPGAYRNLLVVSHEGAWHEGWERIVFKPDAKENAFLTDCKLWTDNTVVFRHAVHPNRWQSVFGAPYLLLKMLTERLSEEFTHYSNVVKELEKAGYTLPPKVDDGVTTDASSADMSKVTVTGFEAVLDLPHLTGEFPDVPRSNEGLLAAAERVKAIRYTLKPKVQLIIRADELAYFLHGKDRVASWMDSRKFEDFKVPGGRTTWHHMKLSNDVGYRYRLREVTDKVVTRFANAA